MDLAQILIRKVTRAFYEPRHIVIIDALIRHFALRDDDLAYLMSMNTKDLHKLCAKLRDDRFLAVDTKAEYREGQQRPINRTYYYIDYRHTIDAIKWRIYVIDHELQGETVPANERKEYFCNRCQAEWTQMEVLDSFGAQGFLCHRCGSVLTHDPERHSSGHEKFRRMRDQFSFMTDLLQKIDKVTIPENSLEIALSHAMPVLRDATHPGRTSSPADGGIHRPTAVRGMANTGPKTIQVKVTNSDKPTEEEEAAERARKEKAQAQNLLPVWTTHSTVTGESFTQNAGQAASSTAIKDEVDSKDSAQAATGNAGVAKQDAEWDEYFERLKEQTAAEAAQRDRELAEEEESDEEGEGGLDEDFEDVGISDTSESSTPLNSAPGTTLSIAGTTMPIAPSPLRQATSSNALAMNRESSSSGTSTSMASPTPAPAESGPSGDGSLHKKVKLEEPVVKEEAESEEEDMEFEDV